MITDTFATFSILVILHHTGNNFLQLLRYLCECSKFVVIGPLEVLFLSVAVAMCTDFKDLWGRCSLFFRLNLLLEPPSCILSTLLCHAGYEYLLSSMRNNTEAKKYLTRWRNCENVQLTLDLLTYFETIAYIMLIATNDRVIWMFLQVLQKIVLLPEWLAAQPD